MINRPFVRKAVLAAAAMLPLGALVSVLVAAPADAATPSKKDQRAAVVRVNRALPAGDAIHYNVHGGPTSHWRKAPNDMLHLRLRITRTGRTPTLAFTIRSRTVIWPATARRGEKFSLDAQGGGSIELNLEGTKPKIQVWGAHWWLQKCPAATLAVWPKYDEVHAVVPLACLNAGNLRSVRLRPFSQLDATRPPYDGSEDWETDDVGPWTRVLPLTPKKRLLS
ncbi:hypothetical protein AB3X52_11380 [Nocardioides sp. DS6]|uniref:Uncharacterized protein n=1 Tax=Nocardioides eburneus TaxID=3231482 RepID=A0ABV3T0Q5_9ACTN